MKKETANLAQVEAKCPLCDKYVESDLVQLGINPLAV